MMSRFSGKIIPLDRFSANISRVDRFSGKVLIDYVPPIYDNEYPIEWNLNKIQNASNPVIYGDCIKISTLVPTVDYLLGLEISAQFNDFGATQLTLKAIDNGTTEEGYYWVLFKSDEKDHFETIVVVPTNGSKVTSGMYWVTDYFLLENIEYSLYVPDIPDEPDIPDVPDTPEATQYLYGHVADSVVTYNGVELPDIESVWDKEAYPVAVIYGRESIPVCDVAFGSAVRMESSIAIYVDGPVIEYRLQENGTWAFDEERTTSLLIRTDARDIYWTSQDILNTDGSVYLQASEPVYSYNETPNVIIDGAGYVGAVLPNIDEVYTPELQAQYPYALIVRSHAGRYTFAISTSEAYIDGTHVHWNIPSMRCRLIDSTSGKEWRELSVDDTYGAVDMGSDPYLWANHDILNPDGTIYITATEPIPVGEIVGYSYNGVTLPELPEWDKTVYPYAVIEYYENLSAYTFTVISKDAFYSKDSYGNYRFGGSSDVYVPSLRWEYRLNQSAEWENRTENKNTLVGVRRSPNSIYIVWADFDIFYDDGSICIEASEPIPVYE